MMISENIIKVILAILLFLCLANMPYDYYQLVRFSGLLGFSILGFYEFKKNNIVLMILYFGLALLFQPFFKIILGRLTWNVIDVIVGFALLASIFIKPKNAEL